MKEDHFYYYFIQGFSIVTINTLQKYPRKSFLSYFALCRFFILFVSPWATYTRIYLYIFFSYFVWDFLVDLPTVWLHDCFKWKRLNKQDDDFKNEQFTRRSNIVWISFNRSQHKWLKTGGDCLIYSFIHLWKLPQVRQVYKKYD